MKMEKHKWLGECEHERYIFVGVWVSVWQRMGENGIRLTQVDGEIEESKKC